jgi:hypothetical protein
MRFRTLQYRNQHREHILCSRPEQITSVFEKAVVFHTWVI